VVTLVSCALQNHIWFRGQIPTLLAHDGRDLDVSAQGLFSDLHARASGKRTLEVLLVDGIHFREL
jgi:hypothetical protein